MRFEFASQLAGIGSSHLDVRSNSLSWSEHRALLDTAAAATHSAWEMANVARVLTDLRYDVSTVARSVASMEQSLSLHLEAQTALLRSEVELLSRIAETLRTPRATRAAERIADAGKLLEDGRFGRALSAAEQAIEDDPNNRHGFVAAGWALLGLERPEEARKQFREAAQCGKEDGAHSAYRQAARLTFLLEGPERSLTELAGGEARYQVSAEESGAVAFDRAVYFAAAGDVAAAVESLRVAAVHGRGFCLMALLDAVLSRSTEAVDAAGNLLQEMDVLVRAIVDMHQAAVEPLSAALRVLNANRNWDAADDVRVELESHRTDVGQYTDAYVAEWGLGALQEAVEDRPNAILFTQSAIERSKRYVERQRAMLSALKSRAESMRGVIMDDPEKEGEAWYLYVGKAKAVRKSKVVQLCAAISGDRVSISEDYEKENNAYDDLLLWEEIKAHKRSAVTWPYLDMRLTLGPGDTRRAYLGVKPENRDPSLQPGGVDIVGVSSGSPAEQAGLTVGDVIVSVAGTLVTSVDDLSAALGRQKPFDAVDLGVVRASENLITSVVLGGH